MNIGMLAAVALGGAAGALGRYGTMAAVMRIVGIGFPYGTLAANILGSFVMGVLIDLFGLKFDPGPEVRAFFAVGFLGAFTTFSTFSLDTVTLIERGEMAPAMVYVLSSVFASVGALFVGMRLTRLVLSVL